MSVKVKKILEFKEIQLREEHVEMIEQRWKDLQVLKGDLKHVNIDDADISLRNIPGGDHIE